MAFTGANPSGSDQLRGSVVKRTRSRYGSDHGGENPSYGALVVTRDAGNFRGMYFKIIGEIQDPKTIASGTSVRVPKRLDRAYGSGRWRKRKGFAAVELASGEIRSAEIHWYEASGVGRREFKIKRFVD